METNENEIPNNNQPPTSEIIGEQEESSGEQYAYKRGDKVNYLGGVMEDFEDRYDSHGKFVGTKSTSKLLRPVNNTFVWAINGHLLVRYVIQHPDGMPKEHFMATIGEDGFESIHSKELKEGLLYIYCDVEDLELVSRKEV